MLLDFKGRIRILTLIHPRLSHRKPAKTTPRKLSNLLKLAFNTHVIQYLNNTSAWRRILFANDENHRYLY